MGERSEMRSLALTPTWSVATVLTVFVIVSLAVERSIHRLSNWLKKTNRKPMLAAVEKMKEELMLLGLISLLLVASSGVIANICIPTQYYDSTFAPCSRSETDQDREHTDSHGRKLLLSASFVNLSRRRVQESYHYACHEGYEPFVTYQGLEQLHRFIFVMAVTHVSYSCLTMLLAIIKVHNWRDWEDEVQRDQHDKLTEITKEQILKRQISLQKYNFSNPFLSKTALAVSCFLRQFGRSVHRIDYLTLRNGFILNHNLSLKYDFHSYMVRSMEEEFQMIVGVSGPLWAFVVAFMLFNIRGSNLYFWIAIIPIMLVLLVGAKLQHVIVTLSTENAGGNGYASVAKLNPRDGLFWFKRPELLLSLIHFILFQNAFELASFFWFLWQFGYTSCFLRSHALVYVRLIIGFAGQFLCSYSTLPLYALVTQMGTNYKAALIPQRIRDTIHGWKKAAKKKRKHQGMFTEDSTIHTDASTVMSLEESDHTLDIPDEQEPVVTGVEFHSESSDGNDAALATDSDDASRKDEIPLLRHAATFSSKSPSINLESFSRSSSLPGRRDRAT